jgi:hypothetical protein
MNWLLIFIVILALYFIWTSRNSVVHEPFTSSDVDLANKIIAFLQLPNNYISYVNFLVGNNNSSVNLVTQATYNKLIAMGANNLTVSDILAQL